MQKVTQEAVDACTVHEKVWRAHDEGRYVWLTRAEAELHKKYYPDYAPAIKEENITND